MLNWRLFVCSHVQADDQQQEVRTDVQSDGWQGATSVDSTLRQSSTQHTSGFSDLLIAGCLSVHE